MADDVMWEIVQRHARWMGRKVAECNPGAANRTNHSAGKVIYPNVRAAREASAEMERAGADPQAAYPCSRSRHGHAHLTRQGAPAKWNPLRRPEDVPVIQPPAWDATCPRCGLPWQRPEGVDDDDPNYCNPRCRLAWKTSRKRARRIGRDVDGWKRMTVADLTRGTVLDGAQWSDEFKQALRDAATPEDVRAAVNRELGAFRAHS